MQTYTNPAPSTFVLLSLHVQIFGFDFLMLALNSHCDIIFFRLTGKEFQKISASLVLYKSSLLKEP